MGRCRWRTRMRPVWRDDRSEGLKKWQVAFPFCPTESRRKATFHPIPGRISSRSHRGTERHENVMGTMIVFDRRGRSKCLSMEGLRTQSIVEWTVSLKLRMASRESSALSDESLLSLSVALWLCENQKNARAKPGTNEPIFLKGNVTSARPVTWVVRRTLSIPASTRPPSPFGLDGRMLPDARRHPPPCSWRGAIRAWHQLTPGTN